MRSWLACILVFLICVPLLAQTATQSQTSTTTTTTKSAKPKTATTKKAPAKKAPTAASEMKTLRDAVNAQQQQIQMLRDELARRDAALQQVQSQVNNLQSTASQAQSTAQQAASASKANEDQLASLKTTVGTVQTSATATASNLQATEKRIGALESPLAIKYKGITITPGGFAAAQVNWRQKNQNLDNFGSFGAIPFNGTTNAHLSEFRATGRYSRLSLLGEGKTKGFNVQGYFEIDFEGAAQTANENQTNSFQPRIREAWANVDAPHGLSFAGGQTWSLLTANRTGVGVRGLALPAHIDASLVTGFHYTRQNTFRVYKTWDLAGKKKFYAAFSVENSETTTTGGSPAGVTILGLQNSPGQPSVTAPGSTFAAGLSVDAAPDLVAKIAFEPGWGHFELGGIARFFRDRVDINTNTGTSNAGVNHTNKGGGLSFNAVMPIMPKKVDLIIATLAGRGIGRYGTTGGSDTTIRPNGTLVPLLGYTGYAAIETHPTPKLDIAIYGGDEYFQRSPYYPVNAAGVIVTQNFNTTALGGVSTGPPLILPATTGTLGFAPVNADLRSCAVEIAITGTACGAANKNVWEISPGFWYRFYKGPAGTIQYGMFFEHFQRKVWTGRVFDAAGNVTLGAPTANENIIMTAFRWYLP